jgi:hypothetical protein
VVPPTSSNPDAEFAQEGASDEGLLTLHYTARAGLLSELSRQTYDSLYKAIREAILNGIDAGATAIHVDLGLDPDEDELVLADDGEGMDLDGLRRSFMSLGGSAKYQDAAKFGRIGIGSLALLTYAREGIIETKRSSDARVVEAHLFHPQALDREQRSQRLEDFAAGQVSTRPYAGDSEDHFTRIRLVGLAPEVKLVVREPTEFYSLVDQMRRVLPLPLGDSRLVDSLEKEDPDLVQLLRAHAGEWSVPITVSSPIHEDLKLHKRTFGDDTNEEWAGRIQPLHRKLRIIKPGERRELVVAGFLINQRRANPTWSGLTARVQNVAVEEHTFFGVETDPGFRKYITGEVFLLGEVDVDHLININRTSFNRESRDYQTTQRFVGEEIEYFKRHQVALGQRRKVEVRRVLEDYRLMVEELERLARWVDHVMQLVGSSDGLPSSKNGSLNRVPLDGIKERVSTLGARMVIDDETTPSGGYRIERPADADRLTVRIADRLATPSTEVGRKRYVLSLRRGKPNGPAVIVKNRPREIVFNTGHPAVGKECTGHRASQVLALELSYLIAEAGDADRLYELMLGFFSNR